MPELKTEVSAPAVAKVVPTPPAPLALTFREDPKIAVDQRTNSFRLGKKWHSRVDVGDVVDLAIDGEPPFGKAEITGTTVGTWDSVKHFAPDNHAVSQFGLLEGQNLLLDIIRGIYPNYDDKDALTVVYFRRTV